MQGPKIAYKYFPLFIFLAQILLVGFLFLYPVGDADLGWHLRLGDYFWQEGRILKTNEFATLMPDYIWANHSWGYDVLLSALYKLGGFTVLSLAGAILIGLSFALLFKNKPAHLWLPAALIFYLFASPILATGLKSQTLSFFFLALIWVILKQVYLKWHKKAWLLPMIFCLWANMHGMFIIGLGVGSLYLLVNFYTQKKLPTHFKKLILIWLLSGAVTFVNPFFYRVHLDSLSYLSSPLLSYISEWQPWPFSSLLMLFFIFYSLLLWTNLLRKGHKNWGELAVLALFNLMALRARRMIPVYLLFSLPEFMEMVSIFIRERGLKLKYLTFISVGILLILSRTVFKRQILSQNWHSYCQGEIACSEGLVDFMFKNNIRGKIFNAYRLGGFLIYHYPQNKVYIDGRMTLWQSGSGISPIEKYMGMVSADGNFKNMFTDEQFDYVILNRGYALCEVLEKTEKWPVLYEDEKVMLFQNPLNPSDKDEV